MQWLNLEDELSKYFKFERDVSPVYQELHNEFLVQRNVPYTNIQILNQDFRIAGFAQHMHEENGGVIIYEYAFDKVIRETGPAIEELGMLDCERQYYGLKLNCLAYMTGKRIKQLVLRDNYNNRSIPMEYKPFYVEKFLSLLTHSQRSASDKVKQKQFALFAA